MKKYILAVIFLLVFCTSCTKPRETYEMKYKEELVKTRELLEDSRSKEVFDAVVRHYNSLTLDENSWHVTYHPKFKPPRPNGIEQYFHPLVTINPGDTVIDAGAGVTEPPSFVLFAKAAGNNGKVIGFEPNPLEFEKLVNEVKRLDLKNTEVYQLGLWNKPETLTLNLWGQASSLLPSRYTGKTAQVKLVKLDDFVKEHKINKVDFIKMDIEGVEKEALLGAQNVLREYKPKLALSAYHRPKDLFNLILLLNSFDLGYKFYLEVHPYPYNEIVLYAKVD